MRGKVLILCPICGYHQIAKHLKMDKKTVLCRGCGAPLFLKYAGKKRGEVDEHDFMFYATELFGHSDVAKELNGVFGCG